MTDVHSLVGSHGSHGQAAGKGDQKPGDTKGITRGITEEKQAYEDLIYRTSGR